MRKYFGLVMLLSTNAALASPAWRTEPWGSGVDIVATNSETSAYNCSYSYAYSYTEYGASNSGQHSGTFFAKANSGEFVASHWQTSWANFQVTNGPEVQCTPAR